MFGSTEYDNECAGCVYDVAPENVNALAKIIDRCTDCKRAIKPEYKDEYEDLYMSKEVNANE